MNGIYSHFETKSDRELIRIIVESQGGDRTAALNELDYRKYLAQRKQNTVIRLLAIVSTFSTLVNSGVAIANLLC